MVPKAPVWGVPEALREAVRDRDAERAVQVLWERLMHTVQVVQSFLQARDLRS